MKSGHGKKLTASASDAERMRMRVGHGKIRVQSVNSTPE